MRSSKPEAGTGEPVGGETTSGGSTGETAGVTSTADAVSEPEPADAVSEPEPSTASPETEERESLGDASPRWRRMILFGRSAALFTT